VLELVSQLVLRYQLAIVSSAWIENIETVIQTAGIRSAKTAGMGCIGVVHGGNPQRLKEADWIVSDLTDTVYLVKLICDRPQ
jgi:hypothetical protein